MDYNYNEEYTLLTDKIHLQDNLIFTLSHAIKITFSLYMAFELDLFNFTLKRKQVSIDDVCGFADIKKKSAQALLSMCANMGLFEVVNKKYYKLTKSAKYYLSEDSPYFLGHLLRLNLTNKEVILSYDNFRKAILTGSSQIYDGKELFKTNTHENKKNIDFTKAMHAKSAASALFWPKVVDASRDKHFLDIGGGSGIHAIAAAKYWPSLKATVFEKKEVCLIANGYIENASLQDRVHTIAGDMWNDPFPSANIHFYCDIFHDWPLDKVKILIEKSYSHLPKNGKIIIHELLFNESKDGPQSVAMCNLSMLMWTQGQQLSKKELSNLLLEAGFHNISIINTGFGDWSITEGYKV